MRKSFLHREDNKVLILKLTSDVHLWDFAVNSGVLKATISTQHRTLLVRWKEKILSACRLQFAWYFSCLIQFALHPPPLPSFLHLWPPLLLTILFHVSQMLKKGFAFKHLFLVSYIMYEAGPAMTGNNLQLQIKMGQKKLSDPNLMMGSDAYALVNPP